LAHSLKKRKTPRSAYFPKRVRRIKKEEPGLPSQKKESQKSWFVREKVEVCLPGGGKGLDPRKKSNGDRLKEKRKKRGGGKGGIFPPRGGHLQPTQKKTGGEK